MRIGTLTSLFEDLLFDLLAWVIFIPKTILVAIVPGRSQAYVNEQSELPQEKRYDATVSPIIFFVAMVLFGIFALILRVGESPSAYLQELLSLSDFGLVTMFASAFLRPLTFGTLLQLGRSFRKNETFGRESFRKLFDVQCLIWGVFVTIGPLVSLLPVEPVDRLASALPILFIGPPLLYMGWLERQSLVEEFNTSPARAFVLGTVLSFMTVAFAGEVAGDIHAPLVRLLES